MTRHMRAMRLKKFAAVSSACAVACLTSVTLLWNPWSIGSVARHLGVHDDPVTVGLLVSIVPVYLVAIWTWASLRPGLSESWSMRDGDRMHWMAIRIVAIGCIFAVDFLADMLPSHQAMAALVPGLH